MSAPEHGRLVDSMQNFPTAVNDAIRHAETYIQWYDRHANRNARVSRVCRLLAVFLGILGGLCPLLPITILEMTGFHNPASAEATIKSLGFVFLACAGGLMLLDNSFGFSSSWMRFKLAQMQLQRALNNYRFGVSSTLTDAQKSEPEANDAIGERTAMFISSVGEIVITETESWITEFRGGQLQIQGFLERPVQQKRPN